MEALCELPLSFAPSEFRVKWADGGWEIAAARRLRRAVFCDEQGLFEGDDRDAVDAHAQLLVALACLGGMPDHVVGTVRLHTEGDGLWWGSRLAVDAAHRRHGHLGATLIRLAVSSARARGCTLFLAHVQAQHGPLFASLHWRALREESLHGRPHLLMQADLAHYTPCHDPLSGFVTAVAPGAGLRPETLSGRAGLGGGGAILGQGPRRALAPNPRQGAATAIDRWQAPPRTVPEDSPDSSAACRAFEGFPLAGQTRCAS